MPDFDSTDFVIENAKMEENYVGLFIETIFPIFEFLNAFFLFSLED